MKKIIIGIFIIAGVLQSCNKKIAVSKSSKVSDTLTQEQQLDYDYAFTEATKQMIFHNYQQAAKLYHECLQVKPKSSAAAYQLSKIYLMMGNKDESLKLARKAANIDAGNIWYQLQLAKVFDEFGKNDSTIAVYRRIVKHNPDRADLSYDLAVLLAGNNEPREAINVLNKIEQRFGASENVSLAKEQIYAKEGKIDEAVDELKKLILKFPDKIQYSGILAELYASNKMNDKAEEIYQKILAQDPSNLQALLSASEFYKSIGNYGKALPLVKKAFQNPLMDVSSKIQVLVGYLSDENVFSETKKDVKILVDSLLVSYPDNIKVHTVSADYYVRINEFSKAADELKFVLDKEKNNYVIWQQFLYIQSELGDFDLMYTFSKEALNYFQDKPELYMFYGLSCLQTDRAEEAVTALQKGLKYADNKALQIQIYTFLGDAYHELNESSKSDQAFDKVLQMDPHNILVLNNYSYYLSERGEHLDKALDMIRNVITKEPENSTYLDTYAWILYKDGQLEKSLEVIEKAINTGGDKNSEIVNHYGDILYKLGNSKEAIAQWKKAIDLGGNKTVIEKKISAAKPE